jgi:hypothetical protein
MANSQQAQASPIDSRATNVRALLVREGWSVWRERLSAVAVDIGLLEYSGEGWLMARNPAIATRQTLSRRALRRQIRRA